MSSIDQQFVEFVVKSLVSNPDKVIVDRRIDEKGVLLELTVDPEDLGRVIGKRGATAQSLRTLLRALGTKNEARYNLKIVDNGVGTGYAGSSDNSSDDSAAPASQPSDDGDSSVAVTDEPAVEEDSPSDRVSQHRRDLAELDDLDV
ncbi:MAG: RNA-binding protein [Candidatus Saccharibacteria bacterium]|nr:RNA-binding protein [Candidatus Saccharibacteria bacterium]